MRTFPLALCAFTALFLMGSLALAHWLGTPPPLIPTTMIVLALAFAGASGAGALVLYVLWLAMAEREPRPIPRVRAVLSYYLAPAYFVERIAPMLATFIFLGALGTFKALIPFINPFAWDTALSDFDRIMFGTDVWRMTHAIVGPVGTRVVDFLYGLWFAEWAIAVFYFSMFAEFGRQKRFFVSFLTLWAVLGIAAATVFSSAGPVFLDLLGHPYADRYHIPLDDAPFAAAARSVLVAAYNSHSSGAGYGISAMPSMHVAVATLIAMALPKGWRIFAWLYWAVIMFGSVHLGWHYASDGIAGTVGAWLIWRFNSPRPTSDRILGTA